MTNVIEETRYWTGPFGILVSECIGSIISPDGINILFKGDVYSQPEYPRYTEEEYKKEYAFFRDNNWYYNYRPKPWVVPDDWD